MKTRIIVLATCAVLAGVGIKIGTDFRAVRPGEPTPSVRPEAGPSQPKAHESTANGLTLTRDPAIVFQRAFWRRASADVRITDAERREWTDSGAAVQRWQWFIALQSTAEFRRWLIDENAFELGPVAAGTALPEIVSAPDWFPAASTLQALTLYRNRGGRLLVFLDSKTGRIFATDVGTGFAAASR